MSLFNGISPNELSVLATAVSIALAEGRTADEVNVLGNFVSAVGTILTTIAAQQQSLETLQEKQREMQNLNNKPK